MNVGLYCVMSIIFNAVTASQLTRENNFICTDITAGTLVPSSVNGDIAVKWEWSNFDPSQNPNPLTDYDKT